MKAVQYSQTGGTEVLKLVDIPKPTVHADQVLVKLEYVGVNFIDTYQRSGLYKVALPRITGRDGAGVIEEIGSEVPAEYGFQVGDRVAVIADAGQGTTAEYIAVQPALTLVKLPPSVSIRDGAAILLQGLTAWTMVRDSHDLKAGEIALVHAAAGGTGGLLVQVAKALGATVIGTVSTEAKAKIAKANGCDHVIMYTEQDVVEEVNKLTDGKGCHVVLSGVGKDMVKADLAMTRRKGTFVSFGNSSGAIDAIRPLDLSPKNLRFVRPTMNNYLKEREEWETRTTELLELMEQGKLKVTIGGEYNMAEVGKAQDDLVSRGTTGKLIIKID